MKYWKNARNSLR